MLIALPAPAAHGDPGSQKPQKEHGHQRAQQAVALLAPSGPGGELHAEALEHAGDSQPQDAGSEAHVIEVVALPAGRHGGPPEAGTRPDQQEADHRGQAGAVEGQIDISGEALPPVQGVKKAAGYNGGDVEQILPQQGEATHKKQTGEGRPGQGQFHPLDQEIAQQHHQGRIQQRGAHAAGSHGVGDQSGFVDLDLPEAPEQGHVRLGDHGEDREQPRHRQRNPMQPLSQIPASSVGCLHCHKRPPCPRAPPLPLYCTVRAAGCQVPGAFPPQRSPTPLRRAAACDTITKTMPGALPAARAGPRGGEDGERAYARL